MNVACLSASPCFHPRCTASWLVSPTLVTHTRLFSVLIRAMHATQAVTCDCDLCKTWIVDESENSSFINECLFHYRTIKNVNVVAAFHCVEQFSKYPMFKSKCL